MDSKMLKFLLKLLSFPNYRAPLSKVKPTPKMKATERNKICQELRDRDLVDCYEEIETLTISDRGKSQLKIEKAEEYLTADELQMLQSASDPISPAKTGLSPELRSPMIKNLARQGFLAVETQIKEVWLTERGQQFLVEEYDAAKNSGSISFKMLADYLQLIRQYNRKEAVWETSIEKLTDSENTPTPKVINQKVTRDSDPSSLNNSLNIWQTIRELDLHLGQVNPTPIKEKDKEKEKDQEILQTIKQLDQELRTDSYLPIFHLREKLQDSFSREELDEALYRLQAQQKIKLKSLEEVLHYSPEYFDAAIDRTSQWSLFFIVLNR